MLAVVLCHAPKEACSGYSCRGWVGCCASRSCFWRSAPVGSTSLQVGWLAVCCQNRLPVVAVTEDDDSLTAMLKRQLLP